LNLTGCGPYSVAVNITEPLTLIGLVDRNAAAQAQYGFVELYGGNITIEDAQLSGSTTGACLGIAGGNNYVIDSSSFTNCAEEGIAVHGDFSPNGPVTGFTLTNSTIAGNAPGANELGNEADGIKLLTVSNATISGNAVYDNGGPGIWFDGADSNLLVSGNRVYGNYDQGILVELATSGRVTDNVVYSNRTDGDGAWLWGACIVSSSSTNIEIDHNVVAWCPDGIGVVSQNRSGAPATITGDYVHDNTVAISGTEFNSDEDRTLLGWDEDWAGTMFAAGNTNRGANNSFWTDISEPSWQRFQYGSQGSDIETLATFNATAGGGGNSVYLTTAQMQAALTAAGVPTTP